MNSTFTKPIIFQFLLTLSRKGIIILMFIIEVVVGGRGVVLECRLLKCFSNILPLSCM